MAIRGTAGRLLLTWGILLLAVPAGLAAGLVFGALRAPDIVYPALLAVHAAAGAALLVVARVSVFSRARGRIFLFLRAPEVLLALAAVFFLFSFIYATNANMDYVQRFMKFHANLLLAPDSSAERLSACLRYLPLVCLDAAWYVYARVARPRLTRLFIRPGRGPSPYTGRVWALPLAIVSAALYALSFPSFIRAAGMPELAFVALIPLFIALESSSLGWGIFYGSAFGVLQTMVSNYWLGTFNLLTLQFVSVVTLVQYIPFMAVASFVLGRSGGGRFLVFPVAWPLFDWLRSLGFLGYPWGILGASQYAVLPLIQISSLTGVWGVTFVVMLCNSVATWYVQSVLGRYRPGRTPALTLAVVVVLTLGWAGVRFLEEDSRERAAGASVRLALVQQSMDPRKDDYNEDFDVLRKLTEETLPRDPDLVVWSETAFVPNIRRWSKEDPAVYPYAALVRDFLAWQRSINRWLITGNDDYTLNEQTGERLDYNGSVLFSPQGERVETYHKLHLVPFTEYFPYKKQLPGVFKLLENFDAYLWEPGDRRVVFRHPKVALSTPICFEDAFADDVRRFVIAGAQVIINLSNDYWSLTDTEAMQHASNAVFRAVENGVPLARASASGLTCLVDPTGRIRARAPLYQESAIVVDVPVASPPRTLYNRWGDWFPIAMALFLFLIPAEAYAMRRIRGTPLG
jgi:apolipoprotein N-acyltransferase